MQLTQALTAAAAGAAGGAASAGGSTHTQRTQVGVAPVPAIWEPIDATGGGGSLKLSGVTMPSYQACFQGF